MRGFWAVCRRELRTYFTTPVAYVFLVVFLVAIGILTFTGGFYENRQADLRVFFTWLPRLFLFLVPCTAMRLWAEERRNGSIELLLTLPITVAQAVLGKFIAAWAFLGIGLLLTAPMPITVAYLGDPDWGPILCGYFGAFLMAGACLGIGCFFSAASKNQIISLILSVAVCFVLGFAGQPVILRGFAWLWSFLLSWLSSDVPAGLLTALERLSMVTHIESMRRGVLELRDVGYFGLLTAGGVYACILLLRERKAA